MLAVISDFPGFYESALSAMIDEEIERVFNTDDSGCNSSIPDEFYHAHIDYSAIRESMAAAYCDAWLEHFESETGIELNANYESVQSPKFYNFTTDRLFIELPLESVQTLFKAVNREKLAQVLKERFTSRDGFLSSYSNNLERWLEKPLEDWDHNEVGALIDAVLLTFDASEPCTWELMENYQCNGHLSGAVWSAIPEKFQQFAELQREHGKPLDFSVFDETGNAYDPESGEPMPPLRCKQTIDLNFNKGA